MGNKICRLVDDNPVRIRNIRHILSETHRSKGVYCGLGETVEPLENLEARYLFEGTLNDTVNNYNLTYDGADSSNYVEGVNGLAKLYKLNSDNSYSTDTNLLSIFAGRNPYTVSMWVLAYNDTEIFKVSDSQEGFSRPSIFVTSDGCYFKRTNTHNYIGDLYNLPIVYGNWTHIVASYDGTNMYLYVNNNKTTMVNTQSLPLSAYMWVKLYGNLYNNSSCVIDEVRIYSRLLTDIEVNALYEGYGIRRVNV